MKYEVKIKLLPFLYNVVAGPDLESLKSITFFKKIWILFAVFMQFFSVDGIRMKEV